MTPESTLGFTPLAGFKVLDLSQGVAGPYCAQLLAHQGAEVVKVEPMPAGEMARQWGPFDDDISVYYLSANRSKQGIGVDFRKPEGLALLRRMALASDIVVEASSHFQGKPNSNAILCF